MFPFSLQCLSSNLLHTITDQVQNIHKANKPEMKKKRVSAVYLWATVLRYCGSFDLLTYFHPHYKLVLTLSFFVSIDLMPGQGFVKKEKEKECNVCMKKIIRDMEEPSSERRSCSPLWLCHLCWQRPTDSPCQTSIPRCFSCPAGPLTTPHNTRKSAIQSMASTVESTNQLRGLLGTLAMDKIPHLPQTYERKSIKKAISSSCGC